MKFPALLLFITSVVFAQNDWVRWEGTEPDYTIDSPYHSTYLNDSSSIGMEILSTVRNGYAFLISDLDGDNCPFYPSCSRFFVLSVKKTNFFQGILMFADRFTRDSNFLKDPRHYSVIKFGKFYDPVSLYTLNEKITRREYIEYHSHD
ncbi:MAG: membrane protein insertion efficiency factor YidD [Ignavibacteria bacterium]|nr:MAG: membrane protein insertion efficiency factor YidD [Ignavibacteria bacterium]